MTLDRFLGVPMKCPGSVSARCQTVGCRFVWCSHSQSELSEGAWEHCPGIHSSELTSTLGHVGPGPTVPVHSNHTWSYAELIRLGPQTEGLEELGSTLDTPTATPLQMGARRECQHRLLVRGGGGDWDPSFCRPAHPLPSRPTGPL